jgi:tRNA (mo5U34)-methyltransferase
MLARRGLPSTLAGLRCLEIGTGGDLWSAEMKRRGAAEVVAVDLAGVQELSPERLGKFDFILLTDVLSRLRNPQLALERVSSVCRGSVLSVEIHGAETEDRSLCLAHFLGGAGAEAARWWLSNPATLRRMMTLAGLEAVQEVARCTIAAGSGRQGMILLRGQAGGTASP